MATLFDDFVSDIVNVEIVIKMVLTTADVGKIIGLIEDGRSKSYVARTLRIARSTVQDAWNRYLETGNHTRRPGSGRKKSTTLADNRFILINSLRDRRATASSLKHDLWQVRGKNVNEVTIRRRLKEAGLNSRRPAVAPRLLPHHRQNRLRFARQHVNWTAEEWRNVLFTDESRVCLRSPDGRERVYRRRNERFADCTISERLSFYGGSVMIWAGISREGRTNLIFVENGALNAHRYIEEILQEAVIPFAPLIGEEFILMQDNATPHVAHVVNEFLDEVGIRRLEWPPYSPDLNPIEHLWDELKRRVRHRPNKPTTLEELRLALNEEYEAIPQGKISTLIDSMPRRMQAVITARGGHTRY